MLDLKGPQKGSLTSNFPGMFLHKPFDNPQKLEKTLVESKLGKTECEGVKAMETVRGMKITYEIRLHDKAPFGVVTHHSIVEIKQNEGTAVLSTKLTLSDFGTDAQSALPNSN